MSATHCGTFPSHFRRLPVSGVATVGAHGANRALEIGSRAKLTYAYRGFIAQR